MYLHLDYDFGVIGAELFGSILGFEKKYIQDLKKRPLNVFCSAHDAPFPFGVSFRQSGFMAFRFFIAGFEGRVTFFGILKS